MPKKIASFALSDEAIKKMDNASKALGMSRSEYVEMMINKGFHFSEEIQEITKLQKRVKERMGEPITDEKPP